MHQGFSIAAQGGGMVAAYHAGVVRGIKERFGFEKLNSVVATSGAAAVYTYVVSGQIALIEPIWESLVTSGRFVSWLCHPSGRGVMDIDFLVDEVIKKKFPLDLAAFQRSRVGLRVGVTDADTGAPKFFGKNDAVDFYELLRASCAVPYFYGKHVLLSGRPYCDGTIGSVLGLEELPQEKNILVVLTRPHAPLPKAIFLRKLLRWLLIRSETQALQDAIWNAPARFESVFNQIDRLQKERNVLVICPKSNLPIYRIDSSLKRLRLTIEQGYNDVIDSAEIPSFFRSI